MEQTLQYILIDSARNIRREGWQIDSSVVADYDGPPWCVTKYMLHGGKQEGVDALEIDNGEMTVTIISTRGMNVLQACTAETTLGWQSPVREVVHPAYIQEESRGGLGWLEGFNELVARCGLESTGAPGEDTIRDNQGNEATVTLPLHGRISNTPASRVWISVDMGEPYKITVSGELYDTRMFGPNYKLQANLSMIPGEAAFTINDNVTNIGGEAAELELLYHCNFGGPLLGEGSRLVAPVQKMSPRDEVALEGLENWSTYGPPQPGFVEQCYYFILGTDKNGEAPVALVSPQGKLAATLRFDTTALPAFTIWKNTAATADGYVTGLEPGTDYPNHRGFEREKGRVVQLDSGDSYATKMTIGLTTGGGQVASLCEEIEQITAGQDVEICTAIDPDLSPA
ncbi:MAG: aldose 1-epimerase family protein [Candidatus Brocadiia bacterium]